MIIRKLFVIILLAGLSGCSDPQKSIKNLPNLTTFSIEGVPEIQLIKDESFRGAQNSEVIKIGDITVDDDGKVYFVDEYNHKIQVVDADGNPVGSMGRGGGRPGEFRKLGNIEVHSGIIYGFDEGRKAMNTYNTRDFNFRKSTQFSVQSLTGDSLKTAALYSAVILSGGNYLVAFQVVESPTNRPLYFYKADESGAIISDQLITFPNKSLFVESSSNGMTIMMMPYERETFLITNSEGNLFKLFSEEMVIRKFDPNGRYVEAWKYLVQKRTLNRSDALDLYDDVDIRRAIRGAKLPSNWPVVANFLVDNEDRFWVATVSQNLENYTWYILGKQGALIGKVILPRKVEIKAIQNGKVYAREINKRTYAEEVVRYEIKEVMFNLKTQR
tara:strand:+ start:47864 stop:49021 length:1158 start_codon:yes stop_codon:yes gene_type:complete